MLNPFEKDEDIPAGGLLQGVQIEHNVVQHNVESTGCIQYPVVDLLFSKTHRAPEGKTVSEYEPR